MQDSLDTVEHNDISVNMLEQNDAVNNREKINRSFNK